jgi:taurine transport system permease protein
VTRTVGDRDGGPAGPSQEKSDAGILADIQSSAVAVVRRDKRDRWLLPVAVIVGLLLLWEVVGRIVGIDPLFFAVPSEIAAALVDYAGDALWADFRISALEFALGMAIALLGIPIGLLIGRSRYLTYAFNPLIDGLYATPILVLTPLMIIWFGLGIESKVAIVALIAFFPLVITVMEGVSTVDHALVSAVRSFGANRLDIYRDVIIPGVTPFIVAGLRLSIRSGVIGVVIGEFIGGIGGVGYRVRVFAGAFETASYLAGIFILVFFAVVMNVAVRSVERRLAPWREGLSSR